MLLQDRTDQIVAPRHEFGRAVLVALRRKGDPQAPGEASAIRLILPGQVIARLARFYDRCRKA